MPIAAWIEHWSNGPGEAAAYLHRIAEAGIADLGLSWSAAAPFVSYQDTSGEALSELLRESGITLHCLELIHLGGGTSEQLEHATDDAYMQMEIAHRLGAEFISFAPSSVTPPTYDDVLFACQRLTAIGERMGLRFCVRNVQDSVVEQPERLHRLVAEINNPNFGLHLDQGAFHRARVNPADMVAAFNERVFVATLSDRQNGGTCLPGDGTDHVVPTLTALEQEGFTGPAYVDAPLLAVHGRALVDRLRGVATG